MSRLTLGLLVLLAACKKDPPADDGGTDDTTPVDSDSDADSDVTVDPEAGTLVQDLQVGDCGAPVDDSAWVERFTLVDCTEPHPLEVAGRYATDHPAYPGHAALKQEAEQRCQAVFETYVGKAYWDSVYDLTTISPSPSSWAGGDRDVVCLVKALGGAPLTEQAGGSGR